MKKYINILYIIFRLFLGGFMIYGGIQKFAKSSPTPIEVVEKANKFKSPEKKHTLQKILYINGAKQTGYFWQVLGTCELVFGLFISISRNKIYGSYIFTTHYVTYLLFPCVFRTR